MQGSDDKSAPSGKTEPGIHTERITSFPRAALTPEELENIQGLPGVEVIVDDARQVESDHPSSGDQPAMVHIDRHSIVLPEKKTDSQSTSEISEHK